MEEVVNSLNNNTGPGLAREILDPGPCGEHVGKRMWNHPQFNIPQKCERRTFLGIVVKFKSKISTDINDIGVSLVKWLIGGILKPLTHIYNIPNWFISESNKIDKVTPLYKSGSKHSFSSCIGECYGSQTMVVRETRNIWNKGETRPQFVSKITEFLFVFTLSEGSLNKVRWVGPFLHWLPQS